jgi:hypothetical protein
MRKNVVAVLLCASVFAACQNRPESAAPVGAKGRTTNIPESEAGKRGHVIERTGTAVVARVLVGTKLGADGAIAEERTLFTVGEPVYLTLRLIDSPVGLGTGAIWYDQHGLRLAAEKKDMNGSKVATFALAQKLAPGKYHVEGYWGGNLAGDKKFEVVAKAKPKRRK